MQYTLRVIVKNYMKKFLKLTLFMCLINICQSCKKESCSKTEDVVYANYSNLKVGNQWIYKHFDNDGMGNVTELNIYDTTTVEKDTIINQNKYFQLNHTYYELLENKIEYLRDSLHYIVNSKGQIKFSSQDFTNVLNKSYYKIGADTFFKLTEKMEDRNKIITVPAGTFTTSSLRMSYEIFPKFVVYDKFRTRDFRYAENFGLVSEVLILDSYSRGYREKKLVRFNSK